MPLAIFLLVCGGIRLFWGAIRVYDDEGKGFLEGCMLLSCGLLVAMPFMCV